MPTFTPTLGGIIAILVFILAVVFGVLHQLPILEALLIAMLALARLA